MKNFVPKCAIINDLAGLGRCSLIAGISTLASMGVQPCPIPTAILSTQTDGFKDYTFLDFTDNIEDYIAHWKSLDISFDSIYTGYLGSVEQVEIVKNFIDYYKDDALVLIDPILGDDGKLYPDFSEKNVEGMKNLIKSADIITPNYTEFCLLTDLDYRDKVDLSVIEERLKSLDISKIVITSIPDKKAKTLIYEKNRKIDFITNPLLDRSFPGTGDMFSSILIGGLTNGLSLKKSTKQAVSFVYKSLKNANSKEAREFGVPYEKILKNYKFK